MVTEYVDVVNENNEVVRTATRQEVKKKALLYRGSHVIVINAKKEFFVQKRSDTKDLLPGMYSVGVGETVESGESYDDAAKRGLREEIGINAEISLLFPLKFRSKEDNENCQVYNCYYNGKLNFNDKEVVEGFFVSKDELQKLLKTKPFAPVSIAIMKRYFEEIEK
jgi:isopentenyldiphosphate isomerase